MISPTCVKLPISTQTFPREAHLENLRTILDSLSDIGGFSVVLVVVHSEDVRDKLSLGECVESSDIMRVFHELEDVETSRVDIVADAEFCVERVDEFDSESERKLENWRV